MCAINGIVDLRGRSTEERVRDEAVVRLMQEATIHRGPDGSGMWSDTFATVGNNRLAILDLRAAANQPMQSASGRYVVVFNGEIYNYKELRATLRYPFSTEGDTEVLLAAYEAWGVDAFSKLRGMFAAALWDCERHEMVLVRDQSGIKPLYYALQGGRLFFSSETSALLDAGIERRMDKEALGAYLRLRYVPEPYSLIAGVNKLPPGSYLVLRGKEVSIHTYFEAPLAPLFSGSLDDAQSKIRELVDSSVASELVSDRPVGVFLSGGLDSTIVLDAAIKARGAIETFTVRFDVAKDEQPEKFNSDADLARMSAKCYGTTHHESVLTEQDFVRLLPTAIGHLSDPVANATAVAQLFLAKEARRSIVVALSGEGGDELFGGYPRYRISRLLDLYQRLVPRAARGVFNIVPEFAKLDTPPGIERIERFLFEKDAMLSRAVAPQFISEAPALAFAGRYLKGRGEADFSQLFMDADRRSWLVDEALARMDAMTMAASLEARVPLLNTDLVLFASRLSSDQRFSLREGKILLRRAFKERLPEHVLLAKKRGFFSPAAKWLRRKSMLELSREVLSPGFDPHTDALLGNGVAALLEDHVAGRGYALPTLWSVIVLRLWARSRGLRL